MHAVGLRQGEEKGFWCCAASWSEYTKGQGEERSINVFLQ